MQNEASVSLGHGIKTVTAAAVVLDVVGMKPGAGHHANKHVYFLVSFLSIDFFLLYIRAGVKQTRYTWYLLRDRSSRRLWDIFWSIEYVIYVPLSTRYGTMFFSAR